MEIKAHEEGWEASFSTHDVSVSEQFVADDFIGTSSSGRVGNKADLINQVREDKNVYASTVSSDMIVRMFGPTVAVVTGVARESGKTPTGEVFSHSYRFTDTWVERNGQWQCVAAHAMALPKKK
jgi:hypothetical protein